MDKIENELIYKLDAENAISKSMGSKISTLSVVHKLDPVDLETLYIVKQLREDLKRVKRERDEAVNDLRECAVESYAECTYCANQAARSFCMDCQDGSSWKWRGVKEN